MNDDQIVAGLRHALDTEVKRHRLEDRWPTIERRLRREPKRRAMIAAIAAVIVLVAAVTVPHWLKPGAHHPPVKPTPKLAGRLVVVGQTRLPRGGSLNLAVGFHAVWVAGVGVTYQIDDRTGRLVRKIRTPGTIARYCSSDIAAGAGAVWVTHGCRGIYRIDPRTGSVVARLRVRDVGAIAVAGGLVWVTDNHHLVRIQPRTDRIIGKPISVGAWTPGVLVPGPGALWVTTYGASDLGNIFRVDLATGSVRRLWSPTASDVEAVGAGSLWSSQVERINPVDGQIIAADYVPGAYAVTFWKGSAWALTIQRTLVFLRIDPATTAVTGKPVPIGKTFPYQSSPLAIGTGPSGLWVLDFYRGLLFHLVLRAR
jgi:hypothetical protein